VEFCKAKLQAVRQVGQQESVNWSNPF
jgi:hypothetical protein